MIFIQVSKHLENDLKNLSFNALRFAWEIDETLLVVFIYYLKLLLLSSKTKRSINSIHLNEIIWCLQRIS